MFPLEGTRDGGTQITLIGSGFFYEESFHVRLAFGNSFVENIQVINSTHLTFETPKIGNTSTFCLQCILIFKSFLNPYLVFLGTESENIPVLIPCFLFTFKDGIQKKR